MSVARPLVVAVPSRMRRTLGNTMVLALRRNHFLTARLLKLNGRVGVRRPASY
jgi:hypothetical protein